MSTPSANRVTAQHERLTQTLTHITLPRLLELHRRNRYDAWDAYPATTLGGNHSNNHPDPTGRTVERSEDPPVPDPARDAINHVFAQLAELLGHAVELDKAITDAYNLGETQRGRQTSLQGACHCCDRDVTGLPNDRLRGTSEGACCDTCYRSWLDAGRPAAGPEYQTWLRNRREMLAAKAERKAG